jgi:hypothetical protein
MLSRVIATASFAFAVLLSGCATPTKMALSNDSDTVSKTGKPIFLMTATLRNTYRTSFQPKLLVVNVEKAAVKDSADRINFTIDHKAKYDESGSATRGSSYLLRMELEEGEYVIRGLTSLGRSFPIMAIFFAPLHAKLKSAGPGVFYLGHVEATVRERENNEFKAGPSIPLIDQAIAGASGGTFDIEISDQWETDERKFRTNFSALGGITVQKAILLPFDRAQAQRWWEAN